MSVTLLEIEPDYRVPLLRVLARLGRAHKSIVRQEFERTYREQLAPAAYDRQRSGQVAWGNYVSWAFIHLKQEGLAEDASENEWAVTDVGRDWLRDHPKATHLTAARSAPARTPRQRLETPTVAENRNPGENLDTLRQARQTMPAEDFRRLFGAAYDRLIAKDRARIVTTIEAVELGRRAAREVDKIHAYLLGHTAEPPDVRTLCAWIEFCYALELERECASLLAYVDETQVDAGTYARAKRLSAAARARLGW